MTTLRQPLDVPSGVLVVGTPASLELLGQVDIGSRSGDCFRVGGDDLSEVDPDTQLRYTLTAVIRCEPGRGTVTIERDPDGEVVMARVALPRLEWLPPTRGILD